MEATTTTHRPRLMDKVARNCEFSGFGPATSAGANSLKVEWHGEIHKFTFDKFGVPDGLTPAFSFQNPPTREVQATFSVMHHLAAKYGDKSPLSSNFYLVEWGDPVEIALRTFYCWLDDPATNKQTVLHTLEIRGKPVWHLLGAANYYESQNANYFPEIENMILDFKKNGKAPHDLDEDLLDSVLDWAKRRGADG